MYSFLYGSHSHKSKILAWYGGLMDFFAIDSLTKTCTSQNHFIPSPSKTENALVHDKSLLPSAKGPSFIYC